MVRAFTLLVALSLAGCRLSYTGGAKTVTATDLAADRTLLRAAPTPVVTQLSQQDCGLAALAMVAGAWGRTWSVRDMARELKPTERGVKLARLRDFARGRGLDAYAIKGTYADLEAELRAGRPVVLGLVLPYDRKNALHHFEVVVAYDPRAQRAVTRDPATGDLKQRTHDVLDAEWKNAGYATLVVVGDTTPAAPPLTGDDHVQAHDPRSRPGTVRSVGLQ